MKSYKELFLMGANHQFTRLDSASHPLKGGTMQIGRHEYLYFDQAYREAGGKLGWTVTGGGIGVYGLATGKLPVSVIGWGIALYTAADLVVDVIDVVEGVKKPPVGPAYVHQGQPLDRRWQNLMGSHFGH